MNVNDLDLDSLPFVLADKRQDLPKSCGVYFVRLNGEILYIGTSANIRGRWAQHQVFLRLKEPSITKIHLLEVRENRNNIERELISHYRPPLNAKKDFSGEYSGLDRESLGTTPVRINAEAMKKLKTIQTARTERLGSKYSISQIVSAIIFDHKEPKK